MFGNILAPLDGSPLADRILPHVAAIAQLHGSHITLLRVLETDGVKSTAVDPLAWTFAKAEAQAHLDETARKLTQLGLASHTVLLENAAAQRIVEYVQEHNVDLIVLSSHGQGGLSGWNVSSVAQKVIHRAGASILLVRSMHAPSPDEGGDGQTGAAAQIVQYRHILAPLDGSQRAENVLSVASALAERHAADLLLAHVVARPEMIQRVPLSPDDAALTERVVARNALEAERYLAQLPSRLPAKIRTRVLIHDSVARALHDLIEQEQVDLVVLSAHGHSCYNRLPYSALVNSFITYGATSLLILQDLPRTETSRTQVDQMAEDPASMPTRSANAEEGSNVYGYTEI